MHEALAKLARRVDSDEGVGKENENMREDGERDTHARGQKKRKARKQESAREEHTEYVMEVQ